MNKKSILSKIDGRYVGASIAAVGAGAATLGNAQNAEAALVVSGPVSISITATIDGVYLNLVTGANSPTVGNVPGWDVDPYGSSTLQMFSSTSQTGGQTLYVGTGTSTYNNLAFGSTIGPASTYATGGVLSINAATPLNLNSSNNCVGFKFFNQQNVLNYGWMQISLSGGVATLPRNIVAYGYGDAGEAVTACTPEPTSLSLLALGALGLIRRRRTA